MLKVPAEDGFKASARTSCGLFKAASGGMAVRALPPTPARIFGLDGGLHWLVEVLRANRNPAPRRQSSHTPQENGEADEIHLVSILETARKETMKDCSDRRSFTTEFEALRFTDWQRGQMLHPSTVWECRRCGRWHLAGGGEQARYCQNAMQRERCLTDRDLHVQMARVCGISLEELDRTMKLDLIRVSGAGIEVIEVEYLNGR